MSNYYQVQFKATDGDWNTLVRDYNDLTDKNGNIYNLAYAFELLGREMACDPDMEHRIVRFAEEVLIAPKNNGGEYE